LAVISRLKAAQQRKKTMFMSDFEPFMNSPAIPAAGAGLAPSDTARSRDVRYDGPPDDYYDNWLTGGLFRKQPSFNNPQMEKMDAD
jgi:hypothetical protein